MINFIWTIIAVISVLLLMPASNADAAMNYSSGSPTLSDIWVDPSNGSDSNTGAGSTEALKTLTRAWDLIPQGSNLTITGYRINLLPGSYPCEPGPEADNCINYFSDRLGTYEFPIIIRAYSGPGTATIRGGLNIHNVRYLYLIDLDLAGGAPLPTNSSGNNLLHLSGGDHILLKGLTIAGPACDNDICNNLQEVLKVNQTQHLYVEDCTIGGAWHSSVDYMVVQYGHFLNNRVHTAGQWCMYIKGGTSYLLVEGNEMYGCQLGFEAGQAANFAVMTSPWIHYDAYDIRFINNILRDIPGVGLSVAGGYAILFAHNTLYRVGVSASNGYGLLHVIHGERNCTATDELPDPVAQCAAHIGAGGWGPNFLTDSVAIVPNRKVYVYNNIFYNPPPAQTLYSHFTVEGPLNPPEGFQNFPSPSNTDDNLVIKGNIVWNGPAEHPLGIEESDQGCRPSNPTCNAVQLRTDNTINEVEPQLMNLSDNNFRPLPGSNVFSASIYTIPDFTWSDSPEAPPVPAGNTVNRIEKDRDSHRRTDPGPPGAYTRSLCSSPATLSPDLRLHLPVVMLAGKYYWADMSLVPGTANFLLTNAGELQQQDRYTACPSSTLPVISPDLRLHMPSVTYDSSSYWADLQYAEGLIFMLVSGGAQ
ncbi:MAG: right-handed parallel beta-helix repeat-containing protein [Nitrospirae bacterium]|nr:right-handed parallel beta-helix repeat-containing protein [Nitrospirota bacterium]